MGRSYRLAPQKLKRDEGSHIGRGGASSNRYHFSFWKMLDESVGVEAPATPSSFIVRLPSPLDRKAKVGE